MEGELRKNEKKKNWGEGGGRNILKVKVTFTLNQTFFFNRNRFKLESTHSLSICHHPASFSQISCSLNSNGNERDDNRSTNNTQAQPNKRLAMKV